MELSATFLILRRTRQAVTNLRRSSRIVPIIPVKYQSNLNFLNKFLNTFKYKMVKPVIVYRSETWAMMEMGMNRRSTLDRKVLRRIQGPVAEQGI